jgi:hypothetical protein
LCRFIQLGFRWECFEGVKVLLAIAHKTLAQQKKAPELRLLTAPHKDQTGDADEE